MNVNKKRIAVGCMGLLVLAIVLPWGGWHLLRFWVSTLSPPVEDFMTVIEQGDNAKFEAYLDKGGNINRLRIIHRTKWTLLHLAADYGTPEMVRMLLERGADVNVKSWPRDVGVLNIACGNLSELGKNRVERLHNLTDVPGPYAVDVELKQKKEIARLLLAYKPDPKKMRDGGVGAITGLARSGYIDILEEWLALGPDVRNAQRAVEQAAGEGHKDVVELLLAKGVNIAGEEGILKSAVENGRTEVVELLIEHGAPFDDGLLALGARNGHFETVKLLLDKGMKISHNSEVLQRAIGTNMKTKKKHELVSLLISHGANVNAVSEKLLPPLHLAVTESGTIAQLLIAHGANVNGRSIVGTTPLHHVTGRGNVPPRVTLISVKYLLEHGADPTIRDNNGQTAADGARPEVAEILEAAMNAGKKEISTGNQNSS